MGSCCAISCTPTFHAIDMVDKAALVVALSNLEKLQVKPMLTPSTLRWCPFLRAHYPAELVLIDVFFTLEWGLFMTSWSHM